MVPTVTIMLHMLFPCLGIDRQAADSSANYKFKIMKLNKEQCINSYHTMTV